MWFCWYLWDSWSSSSLNYPTAIWPLKSQQNLKSHAKNGIYNWSCLQVLWIICCPLTRWPDGGGKIIYWNMRHDPCGTSMTLCDELKENGAFLLNYHVPGTLLQLVHRLRPPEGSCNTNIDKRRRLGKIRIDQWISWVPGNYGPYWPSD